MATKHKEYVAQWGIKHNGKEVAPGATVKMAPKDSERLVAIGALIEKGEEVEEPEEQPEPENETTEEEE